MNGVRAVRVGGVRIGAARKIIAVLIMLAGSGIVFTGTVVMNRVTAEEEEKETLTAVNFTVQPAPKKQEQRERPPERREIRRSNRPALAPIPSLGSNLSGIAVEMPGYEPDTLDSVSESLLGDIDDDIVMTEESVDTPPVVQRSPLTYPERAKQRQIEGKVVVSILIGSDGTVKKMKILEAAPPGVFEEAVRQSVPSWAFTPAKYQDRNVPIWATVTVPFKLN